MNTISIDMRQENACEYDYIPMNIVKHTRKPILQGNTLRGSKQHTDIINTLIDLSVSHVPRSINMWVTWHR